MRLSAYSKDTATESFTEYKRYGGTDHWASYMVFCESVLLTLGKRGYLPQSTINECVAFIHRQRETLGVPLPVGAPWEPVNVRGPYTQTVPGMISEMIAAYNFNFLYRNIEHPQLREIQYVQAIDLFVDGMSVQVKSVQFKGSDLVIDKDWVKGIPDYISLVDIDDAVHLCVPREELAKHVDTTLTLLQLEEMSKHQWDNFKHYPRYD